MSITRLEIEYYKNIGRIADALEALVAQGKKVNSDSSIRRLTAASDLLYGNSKSPLKNNPGTGRSEDNYTYPEFAKKHYNKKNKEEDTGSTISNFQPTIQSELDERIYRESQTITGGEFQAWHSNLTAEERESYTRVYGH